MKLLSDENLTTSEEIGMRIRAAERQRERLLAVNNPRDWRSRDEKITTLARRIDALSDRLRKMGGSLPPLPEKPPAPPSQPLPRDAEGNIMWETVLAALDFETVMIVPDHFQQDVAILAALSGIWIATAPARKGYFALMRVVSPSNAIGDATADENITNEKK